MLFLMLNDWVAHHPGIFVVAAIAGIALLFIRSVIRALQRWEVIPDPLLPERWRRVINFWEQKALEISADQKTYSPVSDSLHDGGNNSEDAGE